MASARLNGSHERPVSRVEAFLRDDDGHWVVALSCGHTQHLRHQPPWQSRAWVMDAAERQRCIGAVFACGWCAQAMDGATLGD